MDVMTPHPAPFLIYQFTPVAISNLIGANLLCPTLNSDFVGSQVRPLAAEWCLLTVARLGQSSLPTPGTKTHSRL